MLVPEGMQDKGMIVKPKGEFKIDCFVDSNFAVLIFTEERRISTPE